MILMMVTEQLYWRNSICCSFRSKWLWLLIAVMKRCAERCVLQLYHTSFSEGKLVKYVKISLLNIKSITGIENHLRITKQYAWILNMFLIIFLLPIVFKLFWYMLDTKPIKICYLFLFYLFELLFVSVILGFMN